MVTTLINIILFENLVSVCTARVKREICEPTLCYIYLHAGTDKNKSLFNQLNIFNLNKKLKGTKIDYNSSFEMSYWKHAYLI